MMRNILIFRDYESGSRNKYTTQPIQIAAVAIDSVKLEIIPDSIFESKMKPLLDDEEAIAAGLDPIEDEALKVNGLTREELAEAPDPKLVWQKYCDYLKNYNLKGINGKAWDAPGRAGFNNCNFDDHIDHAMCQRFGPKPDAYGGLTIYHPFLNVDAFQILQNVFNNKKLGKSNSMSMDAVREYMDYSTENAHDAKTDVLQGADLTIRFLKLFRAITDGKFGAIKFKGCAGGKI